MRTSSVVILGSLLSILICSGVMTDLSTENSMSDVTDVKFDGKLNKR